MLWIAACTRLEQLIFNLFLLADFKNVREPRHWHRRASAISAVDRVLQLGGDCRYRHELSRSTGITESALTQSKQIIKYKRARASGVLEQTSQMLMSQYLDQIQV